MTGRIIEDSEMRDYHIKFRLGDEIQYWIGHKSSLMFMYPSAEIIKVSKIKRKSK